MSEEQLGYAEALAELEAIISELETATLDVDELAAKVQKAGELVRFCKQRIDDAQVEVNEIVNNLSPEQQ